MEVQKNESRNRSEELVDVFKSENRELKEKMAEMTRNQSRLELENEQLIREVTQQNELAERIKNLQETQGDAESLTRRQAELELHIIQM